MPLREGASRVRGWPELAAALLAVVLYLPALGFGFVFDDAALIAADGRPVAVGGIVPYRPLRYASYLVDHWLGGSAWVYHADNILLHALVAALVVTLSRRLGSGRLAALAGGLLVACHPLSVETAAYVAGRRDLLCAVFGLAALLVCHSGRLAWTMLLVLLAAASKESALVFLAPLAAMTVLRPGSPGRSHSSDSSERSDGPGSQRLVATAAVGLAGVAGLALAVVYGAIGPWAPSFDLVGFAFAGHVAAHYLASLFGLHALAPEYPQLLVIAASLQRGDAMATLAGSAAMLVLSAGVIASLVACLRSARPGPAARRRFGPWAGASPEVAFVFAWTMAGLVALAVWGGLHEPGVDRHAALLLPALGVALAQLLSRLSAWSPAPWQHAGAAAAALMLAVLAVQTRSQMEVWRSERTLWMHAAAGPSPSPRAHANLARVLAEDGRYGAAARHLGRAIAADPDDPLLYLGRAAVRCAERRPAGARRDLEQARRHGAAEELLEGLAHDCSPLSSPPDVAS